MRFLRLKKSWRCFTFEKKSFESRAFPSISINTSVSRPACLVYALYGILVHCKAISSPQVLYNGHD